MEIGTIMKSHMEATMDMNNLGKRSGATNASMTNKIQKIEENLRHER